MSDSGFIKLIRSPLTAELLIKDPKAFLVLTLIAYRAKWTDTISTDGLKQGQAFVGRRDLIGSEHNEGISEQNFRSAIKRLNSTGWITTKSTNKGTIVTLCSLLIFDINMGHSQPANQPANQPSANRQPTGSQPLTKKERKKEGKKEDILPLEEISPFAAEAAEVLEFFVASLKMHIPEKEHSKAFKPDAFHQLLMQSKTFEDLKALITWTHKHKWWSSQMLTPLAFKRGFDKALIQKNREGQSMNSQSRALKKSDGTLENPEYSEGWL